MGNTATLEPLEHEIDPDVQKELLKHPGKWAVITRSEFIVAGDSVSDLLKEAEDRGYHRENLILHFVPEDSETVYFF